MKQIVFIIFSILLLPGCSQHQNQPVNPFEIPELAYSMPDYDNENAPILHPAGFIERLSVKPKSECEREDLRKLVIAIQMYSQDFHNQSYYISMESSGVKILLETFPSLKSVPKGDRGAVIYLGKISDHLRNVKINCSKF